MTRTTGVMGGALGMAFSSPTLVSLPSLARGLLARASSGAGGRGGREASVTGPGPRLVRGREGFLSLSAVSSEGMMRGAGVD